MCGMSIDTLIWSISYRRLYYILNTYQRILILTLIKCNVIWNKSFIFRTGKFIEYVSYLSIDTYYISSVCCNISIFYSDANNMCTTNILFVYISKSSMLFLYINKNINTSTKQTTTTLMHYSTFYNCLYNFSKDGRTKFW